MKAAAIPRRFPVIKVATLPDCPVCHRAYARLVGPVPGAPRTSLQACASCALSTLDLRRAHAFAPKVEPPPFVPWWGRGRNA